MKSKKFIFALALAGVVTLVSCTENKQDTKKSTYGDYAYSTLRVFNDGFSKRTANTYEEKIAAQYVFNELKSFGYTPEIQKFDYVSKRTGPGSSQNVLATLNNDKENDKTIVIGAHYDSVTAGHGCDDNASGTVTVLEAAKRLVSTKDLPYDVVFALWGAEEVGCHGSAAYVNTLNEEQLADVGFYINLDSIAAGDYMYAYGGADEQSQKVLNDLLGWSKTNDIGIITQSGKNPEYPAGTTGDWSDHENFKKKNIPFLYFEGTNWDKSEDGSSQVDTEFGCLPVMHTKLDNLDWIEAMYPGRVEKHLSGYVQALLELTKKADLVK